jgi:hypothetical protein
VKESQVLGLPARALGIVAAHHIAYSGSDLADHTGPFAITHDEALSHPRIVLT